MHISFKLFTLSVFMCSVYLSLSSSSFNPLYSSPSSASVCFIPGVSPWLFAFPHPAFFSFPSATLPRTNPLSLSLPLTAFPRSPLSSNCSPAAPSLASDLASSPVSSSSSLSTSITVSSPSFFLAFFYPLSSWNNEEDICVVLVTMESQVCDSLDKSTNFRCKTFFLYCISFWAT